MLPWKSGTCARPTATSLRGPNGAGRSTTVGSFFGFLWSLCYTLWPTK